MQEFLDFIIFSIDDYDFKVSNALLMALVIVLGRLLYTYSAKGLRELFDATHVFDGYERKIRRTIRTIIVILSMLFLIRATGLDISYFLNLELFEINKENTLKVSNIVSAFIVLAVARFIIWIIRLSLREFFESKIDDVGTRFAITQVIKYVIYTGAILTAIQTLGYELTVIWGGAAALLVGFGLGLQQTFNDLTSGIILLMERKVEVGDTVEIENLVGTIKKIGFRTSDVLTRDNVLVIVPNSHLVTANVINWSHKEDKRRFHVDVGVAYGSNTKLVKELLLKVAMEHEQIENTPHPVVMFTSFGSSSLDFKLFFWTTEIVRIEFVKSDLRFAIDDIFRSNNIEIPFPQRDIWIRSSKPDNNIEG